VHGGEYGAAAAARSFVWDDAGSWHLRGLPTMLGLFLDFALPTLRAEGYDYSASMQPYLLEIWIEKSTMDTVLGRLAASHGVRVVTSVGFQSITNAVKFLQRVARAGKGARVLYVSDCDPAGRHMPSSVARQLEFWFQRYAQGADIKLDPVALTREQVQHYHLPRIPIKDSDMRKERFEEVYGEGAVELDALEALYPGELLRLLRSRLDPYVDNTLQDRLADAEAEVNAQARALWREATADLRTEAKALEADARGVYGRYERVLARLSARLERDLEPIRERLGGLQARIAEAQEAFEPPALDAPAPDVDPQGEEDWLYSSDRDYLTQNRYYQARKQGRTVAELDAEAETKRRQEAEDWATMTGPFPGGCPPYNPIRHKLGRLCKRGHAWGSTGQTLRVNNKDTPVCLYCHAEHNYIRRRSRGPDDPLPQWDYDPTRNYLAPAGVAEAQDDEDGAEDEYDAEPTD